jgi:DNA-binding transcriptional ArsR family regulator
MAKKDDIDSTLHGDLELDVDGLKALAHPLRVQIFDMLSIYGSFTASGLAERLNESSGATSYHLRQLEKHGLVREVKGKGTGRERWWERPPGAVQIGNKETTASPAGRSASNMIFRQLRYNEDKLLTDFVERGPDELSPEWQDAGILSSLNTMLTSEQLSTYVHEVMQVTDKYVRAYRGQKVAGARPVHVVVQAFPVVDGTPTTEKEAADAGAHETTPDKED